MCRRYRAPGKKTYTGLSTALCAAKTDPDTILGLPAPDASSRGLPPRGSFNLRSGPYENSQGSHDRSREGRVGQLPRDSGRYQQTEASDARPAWARMAVAPGLYAPGVVSRLPLSTVPPSSSLSSIAALREGGETDASAHKARDP